MIVYSSNDFSDFSMGEREDRSTLQARLDNLLAEKTDLVAKINRNRREIEEASLLRDVVPVNLKSKADELKLYASELAEAQAEIKRVKSLASNGSQLISPTLSQEAQLRDCESILSDCVDQLDTAQGHVNEWEVGLRYARTKSKSVNEEYGKLKSYCKHMSALARQIPASTRIFLKLHEEAELPEALRTDIETIRERVQINLRYVKKCDDQCAALSEEHLGLMKSLGDVHVEMRTIATEERKIALESLAVQQVMADLAGQRDLDASRNASDLSDLATELQDEQSNVQRACQQLFDTERKLEQMPAKAKEAADERERLLFKRKQLQGEIQKKLDSVTQAIITKQSRSPEVMRLTQELEGHWSEHAMYSDVIPRIEQRIRFVKGEVNRKRIVSLELRTRDRDRGITGLDHQEVLYSLAKRANEALAIRRADLERQLLVLEAERKQCLRKLGHTE